MDELSFRRHVLADPYTTDADVVNAAAVDPDKQRFWQEVKDQEADLINALQVPVPEGLADKLLWQQVAEQQTAPEPQIKETAKVTLLKPRQPLWLATAASLMLVAVISWGNLAPSQRSFYDDIVHHVEHVSDYELGGGIVSLDTLNEKLARFGGIVNAAFGQILSANFCTIDGVESLHVQMGNPDNPTSIFILPKEVALSDDLSQAPFAGKILEYQRANVLIMGTVSDTFGNITEHFSKHLAFTR